MIPGLQFPEPRPRAEVIYPKQLVGTWARRVIEVAKKHGKAKALLFANTCIKNREFYSQVGKQIEIYRRYNTRKFSS